jgi:hypothetical protein
MIKEEISPCGEEIETGRLRPDLVITVGHEKKKPEAAVLIPFDQIVQVRAQPVLRGHKQHFSTNHWTNSSYLIFISLIQQSS